MIRYFDIGAHKGGEIRLLLEMVEGVAVYAFEAHPVLAARLAADFRGDERVHVISTAIGDREGEAVLHLNSNLVGSSLYPDKNNVIRGREVTVPLTKFSLWAECNLPANWKEGFNVIKANIEGAEWDLWHDLAENDLVGAFNLWLGAKEGYNGWSADLLKIKSMRDRAKELTAKAKAAGVYFYRFTAFGPEDNSDVRTLLNDGCSMETTQEESP